MLLPCIGPADFGVQGNVAVNLSTSQNTSCVDVVIESDSAIESTEMFLINVTTSDDAVNIIDGLGFVMITDMTTGIYIHYHVTAL